MTQHMVANRPASPDRYRWLQWFAAADPGDTLLLNATRATLGVVASVLAVVALTHFCAGGQQLTTVSTVVLALVGSMLCAVLVSDVTIRDQKITVLLLFLPMACSVVIATLASPVPWLGGILLLASIFLAYYVRRFGPRFAALGMVAVPSFLIPLNTHAKAAQMPWLVITAGVVAGFAYLFRFVILPPRPARVLSRSIAAFHIRAAMVLDQLTESLGGLGPASTKRLPRSIEQLHLSARMIENQLASPDSRSVLPRAELDQLGHGILKADLSIETMSQATAAALDGPIPADVKSLAGQAIQALGAWSREPDGLTTSISPMEALDTLDHRLRTRGARPGSQAWAVPLFRMTSAIRQFMESARQTRRTSTRLRDRPETVSAPAADLVLPAAVASPSTTQPHGQGTGLRTTTQLAIKALMASAIGLPLGFLLSPAHPYYVLVAAYAVITISFGSVLEAALQQTLATVVGSFVGLGCAGLLSGIPIESGITVVLIVVCFFLGVYLSPLSPAWPGFWLALIFALLFNLAGGLETTRGILADQMLGTLVGCTLGILVALFVFPVARTGDLFSPRAISFLRSLEDQIENCTSLLTGESAQNDVAAGARAVDTHFYVLAGEAAPLRYEAGVLGQDRRRVERQLALLAAVNSYTKQLASLVVSNKTFTADPRVVSILKGTGARSVSNIDALCQLLAGKRQQCVRSTAGMQIHSRDTIDMESVLFAPDSPEARSIDGLFTLLFINMAVVELARELGARVLGQDE
jgi:Fusaric acid resistance protein-like